MQVEASCRALQLLRVAESFFTWQKAQGHTGLTSITGGSLCEMENGRTAWKGRSLYCSSELPALQSASQQCFALTLKAGLEAS